MHTNNDLILGGTYMFVYAPNETCKTGGIIWGIVSKTHSYDTCALTNVIETHYLSDGNFYFHRVGLHENTVIIIDVTQVTRIIPFPYPTLQEMLTLISDNNDIDPGLSQEDFNRYLQNDKHYKEEDMIN